MENNAIKVQMGQAIRRLREKERLSQERLALMVGISRQHLSNVESGKANVSVVVLLKIAEGLGVAEASFWQKRIWTPKDARSWSGTCEGRRDMPDGVAHAGVTSCKRARQEDKCSK